jgi:dTMP kinase
MRWIVVDGIDGSGKTTHALWIKEYYQKKGESTLIYFHPSEKIPGKISKVALKKSGRMMQLVAAVFFIFDVLCSLKSMKRESKRYDNIVFVRYLMATAYLPERFVDSGYNFFRKLLPIPERLLLIDIDPVIAYTRITARQEEMEMFEALDQLEKIRKRMLALAKNNWCVIDNSCCDEESVKQLTEILERWDREK